MCEVMPKVTEFPSQTINAPALTAGVQALPPRKIKVIGVPLDLGASRRGVDMGPSAVRVAGLEARLEALGHEVIDGGNIIVAVAETKSAGQESARYLKEITDTCLRADQRNLAPNARTQIFAIEAPGAAYLMSRQLT